MNTRSCTSKKITVCKPITLRPKTITSRSRFNHLRKVGVALSLGLIMVLFGGFAPVQAYDGNAAANWADNNWNSSLTPNMNENCTNFVSHALHAGGFSYVNYQQNSSDDHNWWLASVWWWWNWSNSYSMAPDLYNFLQWHYPGGWNWGTTSGRGTSGRGSGLYTGDVLFYDWGDGKGISHAAIQVNGSYDPSSGWYGNVVDEQTNNRYHAYWSLEPYNYYAANTTITLEHIDPNNH